MKYICSWSGGKDSTACVILAHLLNLPLDVIVFAEVMFDREVSAENPLHMDFIRNVAIPVFESWGYKVEIVRSEKTYLDLFHHIIKRKCKHPEHQGRKFGFPVTDFCSIKRDLKIKPLDDFYKSFGKEPFMEYVGICADEPKRLMSLKKKARSISLLEQEGYTQEMAKKLCEEYGLLSPVYDFSKRGGCWLCPYARVEEHRMIRKLYPEAWKTFVSLEDEEELAFPRWNVFKESLKEREYMFQLEDKGILVEDFK